MANKQQPEGGRIRPVATLLVLATVLPELFSGSTPPAGFVNPGVVVFLFFGYGVAILLVREFAVRCHSGLLGLFVMGLAYSVFNEGLLAKTLILQQNLPVPNYNHYGYLLGISFPWAAGIAAWHACASVCFPVLLTYHFFPGAKAQPWLNRILSLILAGLLVLLACGIFLGNSAQGTKGTPEQLTLLLVLICIGFLLGGYFKGNVRASGLDSVAGPLFFGLSVLIPFWLLGFLASAKVSVMVFFGSLLAVISFYGWFLQRHEWATLPSFLFFGVGWYLHNAIQAEAFLVLSEGASVRALTTGSVDTLVLCLLLWGIKRSSNLALLNLSASAATPSDRSMPPPAIE